MLKIISKLMLVICMLVPSVNSYAINRCWIGLTPFDFGQYYPMQTNHLDSAGTMNINCTGGRGSYTIGASPGLGGSLAMRSLFFNTNVLNYNFYTDPSRSTVWSDISGPNTIAGYHQRRRGGGRWWWWGGGGRGTEINFYGRVFASQDPRPGRYNDMLTITIQF